MTTSIDLQEAAVQLLTRQIHLKEAKRADLTALQNNDATHRAFKAAIGNAKLTTAHETARLEDGTLVHLADVLTALASPKHVFEFKGDDLCSGGDLVLAGALGGTYHLADLQRRAETFVRRQTQFKALVGAADSSFSSAEFSLGIQLNDSSTWGIDLHRSELEALCKAIQAALK